MQTPKIPDPQKPKVPIEAIRSPLDRSRNPLGRGSLISTSPLGLAKKAAYTQKASLLG